MLRDLCMRAPETDSGLWFDFYSDTIEIMSKKRSLILASAALILFVLTSNQPDAFGQKEQDLHLMPLPAKLVLSQGRFRIDSSFSVRLTGHPDARISAAVTRLFQRLQKRTGMIFASSPIADPSNHEVPFEIHCGGAGEAIQSTLADESYTLEVNSRNGRLSAPSPIGILRGLETFLQLVDLDDQSFFLPCASIEDRPRYRWRGLHIDASRHWQPPEIIKRNLDAMASLKMNVFHWHLSDDQGFRMESRVFPKLHQIGSEGNYYTQAEVRDIIAYARDRGIRVIPEFDMPGHTTAWLAAYPELAGSPGPYQIERSWGVFNPAMDPSKKKVYSFLDSFIEEMASIFSDEYIHIGGDEVNGRQWNDNAKIRSFKSSKQLKDNRDLQAFFNQRLVKILQKHGKKMIGWDEILHSDLPQDVVVQSWRGHKFLADSVRRGNPGILSFGYYLDHMRPASFHYENDPIGMENVTLTEEEKSRIIGGEACMWGEFVNPENIESRIWPRAAAIAERLWSPPAVSNVVDMYRRLEHVNRQLALFGLMHRNNYLGMLQRMVCDEGVETLMTIADLLQPTGLSVRVRTRKYSSLTPLNRMVDIVLPESDTARHFGYWVENALADQSRSAERLQKIRKSLEDWRDIKNQSGPLAGQSYLLAEIEPIAETISDLSVAGLQALEYIELQQKPSETWQKESALLIQQSEKPQAEMIIAIVPSIKKLIEAANTIP
jgi:hexosaminidase